MLPIITAKEINNGHFDQKRIGQSYSQHYNQHMQKTFSPRGWLLAALITAGLWISYANEPSKSSVNLKTSDTTAQQFFVAAKEAKAAPVKLGALPANAKHIPEGATVIISANIGELLEKGGYAEFLKSDMFQELKGIIENETAQKIMENPAASGIDIYQPVYIYVNMSKPAEEFGDPLISGGLIAPVKDQKALDKALDIATDQTGLPVNKTPEKGFTQ